MNKKIEEYIKTHIPDYEVEDGTKTHYFWNLDNNIVIGATVFSDKLILIFKHQI